MKSAMDQEHNSLTFSDVGARNSFKTKDSIADLTTETLSFDTSRLNKSIIPMVGLPGLRVPSPQVKVIPPSPKNKARSLNKNNKEGTKSESLFIVSKHIQNVLRQTQNIVGSVNMVNSNIPLNSENNDLPELSPKTSHEVEVPMSSKKPEREPVSDKAAKYLSIIVMQCQKLQWNEVDLYVNKLQKYISDGKISDQNPLTGICDKEFGWTPLMHAVRENMISIAGKLIELGCEVNARNKESLTSLHIASLYGHEEMFRFLMVQNADAQLLTEPKKQNVLHLACSEHRQNNGSLLRTLLNFTSDDAILHPDKDGHIPLHLAINSGCREACEELLTKQVIEQIDYQGGPLKDTALHMAVRKKKHTIAWILMSAGAYINNTNAHFFALINLSDLQTPLHIASEQGDERFVKWFYIWRAKANVLDKFGHSAAVLSVTKGHKNVLDILVDKFKTSVFERTKDGSTLVHVASLHGHPGTAMSLHDRGVPLKMPNRGGARSLHIAARHGRSEILLKLIQKGEDVDAATNDNYTALHIATEYGQPQAVETLLGQGANVHIKGGKTQETALHIAGRAEAGEKCVPTLLQSGADPNLTMENGETALHVAARNGKLVTVKLLLEDGADPEQKSKNGCTPLHLASKHGQIEVVDELLQFMKTKGDDRVTLYCNMVTDEGESALHFTAGLSRTYRAVKLAAEKLPTLGKVAFPSLHKNKDVTGIGKYIAQSLLDHGASVFLQTRDKKETAFHYCAKEGNNDILRIILEGLSAAQIQRVVNKRSSIGWTPLLTACKNGYVDIVRTLLEFGARVDIVDNQGCSGLHLAAEIGNKEICSVLLNHNAFVNVKSKQGLSPLHLAAQNGFTELCQFLIEDHGATVDILSLKKETPLHLAAKAGRLHVCHLLMELGAEPEAENERGELSIHLATNNHPKVMELFLNANSHMVSSTTKDGSGCAHLAAGHGSISTILELMKFDKGEVISARDGNTGATALHIAAEGGHTELVKSLLDAGADSTDENKNGYTAVHLAAKNGHTSVIDVMKHSLGFSMNSKKHGMSALHIASFYGQHGAVREILQHIPATITTKPPSLGKNSFIKDLDMEYGLTPLHMAAISGEENIVRLLLNYPAVQEHAPTVHFGFNALHLAASRGHEGVVGVLLSRSFDLLNSKDASGKTALHLACVSGQVKMCQLLLSQGAQIDALDCDKWTPLHCAAKVGHLQVVKLLIDGGASAFPKTNKGNSPIWLACVKHHVPVLSYLLQKEHDTYALMEDDDFIFNLTICGSKIKNDPLIQFVLASRAPVEVAGKLSSTILAVSLRKKEREKELIAAAKQIEAVAIELLILATWTESPEKILTAVDKRGISLLDLLMEYNQKEVVAHPIVQNYLQEIWHGHLTWENWKIMILFLSFILLPPVWVILSLPLGHRFYKIPIIKFMSYFTSHIHLIILLCLICVPPIRPVLPIRSQLFPFWNEWVFLVWIFGSLVSEVFNPSNKGGLGWIKSVVLLLNILGVIVHGVGFFIAKESFGVLLYIRNQMFACAVLFATVQILEFLSFHYLFGPWAIIIGNLMKDLTRFLAILLIFIVGFCLIMSSINSRTSIEKDELSIFDNFTLAANDLQREVLVTPIFAFDLLFFAIFDNIKKENVKLQPNLTGWPYIIAKTSYATFLAITVIVLVNLLIATMSNTYHKFQSQSEIEWKYGLAKLICNYNRTVATPSPINIFTIWMVWIYKLIKKAQGVNFINGRSPPDVSHTNEKDNEQVQLIESVTDWRLIAKKYRDLIQSSKFRSINTY